ncbi:patatin-like phospholipase family protein [bacterium]|nr:patatin-like phospholipase family protein [bacterium]
MFEFLKGKTRYALALGSGGAKGFVHIGVIKALEELDIEITHIGGTSIGALIGGMYALWGNISQVETIFVGYDTKRLLQIFGSDVGLLNGVLKGDAFMEELEKYVGNASISDCAIPFIAVSVNILTGEKVYHTSGLLKDAMRASSSIPLVFKPFENNGRYLVDGALAESVPVHAVKSIGGRKVLGVNVQGLFEDDGKKLNIAELSNRIYLTNLYHIAQKDLESANKKLFINIKNNSLKKMVEKRVEYIDMGYKETLRLFK